MLNNKDNMNKLLTAFMLLAILTLFSCEGEQNNETKSVENTEEQTAEVNVYSHRFYDSDKALFAQFEEETGIKVNVKMDDADRLIQLLQTEGENTPADLLITTDIGRLYYAKELGLLQSVSSALLTERIPAHLRSKESDWFGLTKRARVIMYNPTKTEVSSLSTYEDLADPKWKGQISIRSSSNVYNKSLMASLVAHLGEEEATQWAKGIVANMATEPKGNDRDQIKNIVSGTGSIAITNTYYLGLLVNSDNPAEREAAQNVVPFFPNQDGRGAHINLSGAGVVKGADNAENAVKLLEFLVSEKAQSLYVEANYEYPVNPNVKPSELLSSWGDFVEDTLNLEEIGQRQKEAIQAFADAEWN